MITDLYCKPTDGHQYLHFESFHQITQNVQLFLGRLREYEEFVLIETVLLLASKRNSYILKSLKNGLIKKVSQEMVIKGTKGKLETPSLGFSKASERTAAGNL